MGLILGLIIGGFLGGIVFRLLGLGTTNLIGSLVVSVVGAVLLIVIIRKIKR